MKWYGSVLIAYLMLTGCTSYRDCDTLEDRIEARYKQNVIMPTDSWPLYKGMKHAFFDIITVGFCEFWYAKVRSTYEEQVARQATKELKEREAMARRIAEEEAEARRKAELLEEERKHAEREAMARRIAEEEAGARRKAELLEEERKHAERERKVAFERERLALQKKRESEYMALTNGLETYMASRGRKVDQDNSFAGWCKSHSELVEISKMEPRNAFDQKRKERAEKVVADARKNECVRILEAHKIRFADYKKHLFNVYNQIKARLKEIPKNDNILSLEDELRLSGYVEGAYLAATIISFEEALKLGVFESETKMQEECKAFLELLPDK